MNIVNRLTLRCLKQNKRRTVVTMIAIALSVLMLTAVFTVAVSFVDMLRRESIAQNGEWHAQLAGVPANRLPELEKAEGVGEVLLTREVGFAPFAESTNSRKPYFYVQEYNAAALAHLLETPVEGRLPQKEGEAVIAQEAFGVGCPYRIGDAVTLTTGYRTYHNPNDPQSEKRLGMEDIFVEDYPESGVKEIFHAQQEGTYQITGIIKTPVRKNIDHLEDQAGFLLIGYRGTESFVSAGAAVDPKLLFDPLRRSVFEQTQALAKQMGAEDFGFNHSLLGYAGITQRIDSSEAGLLTSAVLVLLAILAGFSAMIYNAFSISVAERTQYLGLLASVGATGRQKRGSVFYEGMVLGAIAIPAGLSAGLGGVGLLLLALNPLIKNVLDTTRDMRLVVSPLAIVFTVILSVLLIALSLWVPARRAARMTPIDSIRKTDDIRLTAKALRTGRVTRRLFGYEGEIALKNLKRSRRRYRITVTALAVSVVMILTVSYAAELFGNKFEKQLREQPCDMVIDVSGSEAAKRDELFQKVLSQGEATRYAYQMPLSVSAGRFPVRQVSPDYVQQDAESGNGDVRSENGYYHVRLDVYALDEASFQTYLKEIGEDWADYRDPAQTRGILLNTFRYDVKDGSNIIDSSIKPVFTCKAGDRVTLESFIPTEEGKTPPVTGTAEIGAVTHILPFGIGYDLGSSNRAYFLVPQKTGEAMQVLYEPESKGLDYVSLCLDAGNPAAVKKLVEEYRMTGAIQNVNLTDYAGSWEETRQLIQLLSIFCGVVVALIASVCAASMFNTISTNLILRRREFAMLRSVGMTQKSFRKMLRYESLFYGLKTLLYGLPVSLALMAAIYWGMKEYDTPFSLPWLALAATAAALFLIVGGTMLYTGRKLKQDNIIETLKDDVI